MNPNESNYNINPISTIKVECRSRGSDIGMYLYLSLVMRKPAFCICENKDTDQLRNNCAADQRLCFRYTDSTIPLPNCELSRLCPSSVVVQTGLCQTWSETPKTGFLTTRLIFQASATVTTTCSRTSVRTVGVSIVMSHPLR